MIAVICCIPVVLGTGKFRFPGRKIQLERHPKSDFPTGKWSNSDFRASVWPLLESTVESCGGKMFILQDTHVRKKSILHVVPVTLN